MRCSLATTMLYCYLLTLVTMLANGQAYHFSQGWLPGRKRSASAAVDSDLSQESTLSRLLKAEYDRRTAAAVEHSIDDNGPFTVISHPGQQVRARLLRLVSNVYIVSKQASKNLLSHNTKTLF